MRRLAAAALCGLAFTTSARDGGFRAECDADRRSVRIEVPEPYRSTAPPLVYLDGHEGALDVREWTPAALVAMLPRRLGDGAYRIVVREAARAPRVFEVPLVVGVVGPLVIE